MSFRDLTTLKRRYAGQAGQLVNEFYGPVLRQSYDYDRQAGYFDSATLVQLAAGLAGFIENVTRGGTVLTFARPPMRLITGATWTEADRQAFLQGHEILMESLGRSLTSHCFEPSDKECLRLGLPPRWRPTEDQIARHRLGTLAWMVSRGLLEVRIALPLDHLGRPYQAGRGGGLFHPKAGILYNGEGTLICFQCSVNETGATWTRNREKFALTAWLYDGLTLTDVGGRMRVPARPPWNEEGLLIVSRHYIMRQARQDEVLSVGQPWDAVIVDEAHAARRRSFASTSRIFCFPFSGRFAAKAFTGCYGC